MMNINDIDADYFESAPDAVEVDSNSVYAIIEARRAAEQANANLASTIHEARESGATWQTIGAALGISRQAAHAKYAKTS